VAHQPQRIILYFCDTLIASRDQREPSSQVDLEVVIIEQD
jgi:hypothetical protein